MYAILKTDGLIEFRDDELTLELIKNTVEGSFEEIRIELRGGFSMLVREAAFIDKKPLNSLAGMLAEREVHGNAIITGFPEEGEFTGISDEVREFLKGGGKQ